MAAARRALQPRGCAEAPEATDPGEPTPTETDPDPAWLAQPSGASGKHGG
jgi:hypothetical protein